jgi:hypothetical protein
MKLPAVKTRGGPSGALATAIRCLLLAAAVAVALTVQGCTSTPVRGSPPQASAGTSCPLTVTITSSLGTTWGTVTAAEGGSTFTFGQATRTVGIPCGATVHLSERPTDSNSWPFHDWRVGTEKVIGTSTSTVVTGAVEVNAVYVLGAPDSAVPTPSASGN